MLEQREAGRGVAAPDVGRHLGEEARGRDAGGGHLELDRRQRGRRHAQQAGRAAHLVLVQQPVARRGRHHGHRPRVGDGRGHRAEADPLHDAEAVRELADVAGQRPPQQIGLGAVEDQQVAARHVGVAQQQLGPRQVAEDAVDDVEQGPPRAVVVERVGIEPRDHLGARRQLLDRGRRGGGSVDPPVEGRDDDGLCEHRQVAVEGVERHPWRIPRRGGQPSASSARCRFRYARTLLRLPHTSIEHHARRWLRDES